MNGTWAIYDSTGFITKIFTGLDSSLSLVVEAGELALLLEHAIPAESYHIVDGVLTLRPTMSLTISALTVPEDVAIVVGGIPVGTAVTYPGGVEVVDDGFIEWASATAGAYTLILSNFPYKTEVLNAQVTET